MPDVQGCAVPERQKCPLPIADRTLKTRSVRGVFEGKPVKVNPGTFLQFVKTCRALRGLPWHKNKLFFLTFGVF